MDTNQFFGYGSCDAKYDIRRHLNVILHEFMAYKLYVNDQRALGLNILHAAELPLYEAAEYVCNDILTFDEHNFLNILRERYNVPDEDFIQIMSGRSFKDKISKSPAGYSREQNIRLLVQMAFARYYMKPQNNNAIMEINTMIASLAQGMRGINLTPAFINNLFKLTDEAIGIYGNNFAMKEMEDYVINRIGNDK